MALGLAGYIKNGRKYVENICARRQGKMINIRLLESFKRHHLELGVGEIIGVRSEVAHRLVSLGVAEYAESQKEILEPHETRIADRPRGRPRMNRELPS
jgi:hypothetical protein